MASDLSDTLFALRKRGSNRVENLPQTDEYGARYAAQFGGGGGGQRAAPPFGGGGMDPWQSGVERQLGSLDARAGRIEERLGDIRADVSSLKTRVDELPTKWFMVMAIGGIVGVITAVAKLI